MPDSLSDKTAVVTGAASGIGLAIARECARSGINVVLADVDEAGLGSAAVDVNAASEEGRTVLPVQCDVTDFHSVKALAHEVGARCGIPDVVVANAGVVDVMGRRIWESRSRRGAGSTRSTCSAPCTASSRSCPR